MNPTRGLTLRQRRAASTPISPKTRRRSSGASKATLCLTTRSWTLGLRRITMDILNGFDQSCGPTVALYRQALDEFRRGERRRRSVRLRIFAAAADTVLQTRLRAGDEFGRYRVDAFARNLTDARGVTALTEFSDDVEWQSAAASSGHGPSLLQPRTFGLSVRAQVLLCDAGERSCFETHTSKAGPEARCRSPTSCSSATRPTRALPRPRSGFAIGRGSGVSGSLRFPTPPFRLAFRG